MNIEWTFLFQYKVTNIKNVIEVVQGKVPVFKNNDAQFNQFTKMCDTAIKLSYKGFN